MKKQGIMWFSALNKPAHRVDDVLACRDLTRVALRVISQDIDILTVVAALPYKSET